MSIRRTLFAAAIVAALTASSCAGSMSQSGSTTSSGTRSIRVDLRDRGRTVSMGVGDRLVIVLAPESPTPGTTGWVLSRYPSALTLNSPTRSAEGRFVLTARSPGGGTLFAIGSLRCVGAPQCPAVGADAGASLPARPVSFMVNVKVSG